jgi:nucleoside-diphosphate-sugar epimerase
VNTSSKPWRVLVTGAGGFVGAAVCNRLLEEGHTVVAARRPGGPLLRVAGSPLEQLEADLRDPDAFRPLVRAARPDMPCTWPPSAPSCAPAVSTRTWWPSTP